MSGDMRDETQGKHTIGFPRWRLPGFVLLCVIIVSVALLAILNVPQHYENPPLATALNFIFITLISLFVAVLAARSFLITGSWHMVWTGVAALIFGINVSISGALLGLETNVALTVHNGGALAAGLCQVVSAGLALRTPALGRGRPGRSSAVLAAYGATLGSIALFTLMAMNGLLPAFFIPIEGFTWLRQAVLGTATGMFALAAAAYVILYAKSKSDFVFWYCLSLATVAIGLAAVLVQPSVGSVLSWVGRGAQQVGGIYLLLAVVVAVREARAKKVSIEEALAGFFRDPLGAYRLVFEAAFNAIISTGQEGRVQLWNPAAERMFGYSSDEAVGKSLSSLVVPPGRDDFIGRDLKMLRAQAEDVLVGAAREVEATRKSGERFPAMLSFSARRIDSGWLTSIQVTDISGEKRAEEALRQSEQRWRMIVSNSPDTVFHQDRDLRYLWVANPTPPLAEDQVVGKTDFDLVPADEVGRVVEVKRRVLDTGIGASFEARVIVDGEERWYDNIVEPWRDAEGRVIGLAGYSREITERKRVEVERERLLLVAQEANAEAHAAVRARDEFLSVAAHELKTPVTSLRGYAQVLLRQIEKTGQLDPSRVQQAMAQIDQQSARLAILANQLLDLSRLEAGKLVLAKERADVAELVESIVGALQRVHPQREFVLDVRRPLMAEADPLRLEQVVMNLLDNAVKFSPKGGPVEIVVEPNDSDTVRIAVRDHGPGIPAEKRARIFERFYQAHDEWHGGMGLGLFISRQIVELHGGSIAVECPANGGTSFLVNLPMGRLVPAAHDRSEPSPCA